MRRGWLLAGAALVLTSALAIAQDAPESLLPPGFDDLPSEPAPTSAPSRPAPSASSSPGATGGGRASASGGAGEAIQPLPDSADTAAAQSFDEESLARLPTLEELETMSPEELEEALDIKPEFDIPPAARRSLKRVGIIDRSEGGFSAATVSSQNVSLIKAILKGNRGKLVSRWGHILLRRALASRMDAPKGMDPAEFAALRASLLLRMGEVEAARSMVQDVDTGNFNETLTDAAFDAYVATADFTGICPAMLTSRRKRTDPQWEAAGAICTAFRGDSNFALSRLDRFAAREAMPKIDLLLAQKYAGAAGKARRAVNIEWDGVTEMPPWRYGLTMAVGLEPPERLMGEAIRRYASRSALAPMLGLERRAEAADWAAGMGILSSSAMVDLYSQIYSDADISSEWADRAGLLRDAYVESDSSVRLMAMQNLWNGANGSLERYSRQVLTAYAAARMPAEEGLASSAPDLISSMLAAGLDHNAARWAGVVEEGSEAWAMLALAVPKLAQPVGDGMIDSFLDDDDSAEARKSAFLLAGLAGLGRISTQTKDKFSNRLDLDLDRQSHWTKLINSAAGHRNPGLVAMLAGLGMQGSGWDKMTPRYLYTIVSALRRAGLEAEARMIAAEALARG